MKEYPFQYTSKQYLVWGAVALLIGFLINALLGFGVIACLYSVVQAYWVRNPYVEMRDHTLYVYNSFFEVSKMELSSLVEVKKTRDDALLVRNKQKEIRIDLLFLHYDQAKELSTFLQTFSPTPTTIDLSQHLVDDL